jgi:hypothetical protein
MLCRKNVTAETPTTAPSVARYQSQANLLAGSQHFEFDGNLCFSLILVLDSLLLTSRQEHRSLAVHQESEWLHRRRSRSRHQLVGPEISSIAIRWTTEPTANAAGLALATLLTLAIGLSGQVAGGVCSC